MILNFVCAVPWQDPTILDTQSALSIVTWYDRFHHNEYTHVLVVQILFHNYDSEIQRIDFGQWYDLVDHVLDLVSECFAIVEDHSR